MEELIIVKASVRLLCKLFLLVQHMVAKKIKIFTSHAQLTGTVKTGPYSS